ncbi:MAG: DnaD domain protein [Blautia sp.]|nr:DnaD domain protein [Blautia sp.]MDY5032349.1 DnaD domain protein [Blautia sp.]
MNHIQLHSTSGTEVTILPNRFIDQYMPGANGEFVKIYIYLRRILSGGNPDFDLAQMADRLLCTERDIFRALKYWEKEQLLSLQLDENQKLCGITLLELPKPDKAPEAEAQPEAAVTAEGIQDTASVSEETSDEAAAVVPAPTPETSEPRRLTPDRILQLKQDEEIVQLLYITEQYLGKTLTATEMQKILFFYDELKMSPDLIEYLIEYCITRGHKSIRYIETVALAWAKEGITSVSMAKQSTARYGREYFTVLKAMGITGRNPVENEVAYIDTWMKDYGFDMALITEACSRTVLQTGQPSFQYTDKILAGWKKKQVRTLDDVKVLDAEHKKRRAKKAPDPSAPAPKAGNRFNNFQQREYNFDEYEKRLLNQ